MESYFEYRVVCDCHGPLVSGLTKEQAEDKLSLYQTDNDIKHARIEFRRVSYTNWKPNG